MKRTTILKRRVVLRPMSKRRQREAKEYSNLRKEFLAQRPICEAHSLVTGETKVFAESTDVHHIKGRYKGNYLNRDSWLAVCRQCHCWITENAKKAERLGLLDSDRNRAIDRLIK